MQKNNGELIQQLSDSEWLGIEKRIKKSLGAQQHVQEPQTPETIMIAMDFDEFDRFDKKFGGFGFAIIQSRFTWLQ